jgi:ribonuclease HI
MNSATRNTAAGKATQTVELFTDGACQHNPGPGGWAFILRHPASGRQISRSGGESMTTNNRMELMAVIRGLESLKRPCHVKLYTDSTYVGRGLTEWLKKWKARGWLRNDQGASRTIKNLDLWLRLDQLLAQHQLQYIPVRGHSGHPENEACDRMAVEASQRAAGARSKRRPAKPDPT